MRKQLHRAVLSLALIAQAVTPAASLILLTRTVAQMIVASTATIPIAAMADEVLNNAQNGQTLGDSLVRNAQRPQFDPATGTFKLPDGKGGWLSIPQGQLFANDSSVSASGASDTSRARTNYGNHNAFAAVSAQAELRLLTESSRQGNAYQTIRNSALAKGNTNLRNDPVWSVSDQLLSGTNPGIGSMLQACTTTNNYTLTSTPRHLPSYETCDRTQKIGSCNVRRIINGVADVAACTPGSVTNSFTVDRNAVDKITGAAICAADARTTGLQPVVINAYGVQGQNHGGPMTVTVNTSTAVTNAPLATLWPHWYGNFRALGVSYSVPGACAVDDPVCTFTLTFSLQAFSDGYAPTVVGATVASSPATSCPSGQTLYNGACYSACAAGATFVAGTCRSCPLDPASGKTGAYNASTDRCEYSVPGGETWTRFIEVERFRREVQQSLIDTPPGCATSSLCSAQPDANWAPTTSLNDQASTNAWQCSDASNSRTFFGIPLTPATVGTRLGPLYPGAPASPPAPLCFAADARHYACNFNLGQLPCYTDVRGVQHCPYSKPGTGPDGKPTVLWCEMVNGVETCTPEQGSTCGQLQARPECTFVKSECTEGAKDPATGLCMAYTDTYDCGTTVDTQTVTNDSLAVACPGAVRCMGTECRTVTPETNTDFTRASVALSTLQMAQMDSNCSNGTCEIFKGEVYECKVAVGGLINCCDKPKMVSVGDYIRLAISSWNLMKDSQLLSSLFGSSATLRGAWEGLSNGVTSTMSEVLKPIMTPLEALVSRIPSLAGAEGELVGPALESIPTLGLQALQDALMEATYNFVADTFGPEIVTSLFDLGPGGVTLASAPGSLGSLLSTLMTVYTVIMIAIIILQIIYACEKKELELGVKRATYSCHQVGTYCRGPLCIEKRHSYCCFASPLSRIINEQARPQIGRSWGTPQLPQCGGFSPNELAALDWSKINLDEWIALLQLAGLSPTEINQMLARYGLDITARNVPPGEKKSARSDQIIPKVLGNNANPDAMEKARDRIRAGLQP